MPKRMQWIYTCSFCKTDYDTDEKIVSFTLSGPGKDRALDVCATCAEDEIWRSVMDATYPVAKQDATTAGEVEFCELCPGREFKNKLALSIHNRKIHGIVSETRSARQQREAKSAKAIEEAGGEFTCTHPGCDRSFDKSAKLSGHMRWHKTTTPPIAKKAKT